MLLLLGHQAEWRVPMTYAAVQQKRSTPAKPRLQHFLCSAAQRYDIEKFEPAAL
jgi:hypothetical protein